jgi:hypothetical protein
MFADKACTGAFFAGSGHDFFLQQIDLGNTLIPSQKRLKSDAMQPASRTGRLAWKSVAQLSWLRSLDKSSPPPGSCANFQETI